MASQLPPKRILVVDDNRDAADLTAQLLEFHGYSTSVAYGGRECIRSAAEFHPDVILLDLGMPGMDGFDTALALRVLTEFDDVVLVTYSAWGDAKTQSRARTCGFDGHLHKPARIETILLTIASTVRQHNLPVLYATVPTSVGNSQSVC